MEFAFLTAVPSKITPNVPARRAISMNVPDNLSAPIKFVYMNKRPASSKAAVQTRKLLTVPSSTGKNIGPGKYNTFSKPSTPSFEFSRTERFSNSDFFAKFFLFKKPNDEEKKKIKERVEKNKEIAVTSREKRESDSRARAIRQSYRLEVVKMTQKKIFQDKQKKKIINLQEKFKKYEYRMNLCEIGEIKKTWLLFCAICSIATVTRFVIAKRKEIRRRSIKMLSWLRMLSKAIGKFKRMHVKIKYFKGLRIIKIYLLKYVKLWVIQRRKRHLKAIAKGVEKSLTSYVLKNLTEKWLEKINKLKRIIKSAIFFRLSLYQSLIVKWNRVEHEIFETLPLNLKRKRRNISMQSLHEQSIEEGQSRIPAYIKMHYLRKYVYERTLAYVKDYNEYKAHFQSIHRQNKQSRFILGSKELLDYPIPPRKPNIFEDFTKEATEKLIKVALKDINSWVDIENNMVRRTVSKKLSGIGFL